MFFNKLYLASIEAQGGFFVVKAKGNLNPTIRRAYTPEGREIKCYRNQPLKNLKPKMGKYKVLDLDVEWEGAQGALGRDMERKEEKTALPPHQSRACGRRGLGSVRFVDQVKTYRPGHVVTAEEVRAMVGVLNLQPNVSKGLAQGIVHKA